MDGVGIHIEGGELADFRAVVVAAVGEIRGGNAGAHRRNVLGAHELEQLDVGRLHHVVDDRDRLRPQARLSRGGYAHHVAERRIEEARLGRRLGHRGDRGIAALHGDARGREAALHTGAHLVHFLVEVTRDVAHQRDPVLVVGEGAERPPRGVAEVGPERGVGIGRHLEVAELLIGDQPLKLQAVDVVVHLLRHREAGARDGIELLERVVPALQSQLLRGRVDLRQVIGDRAGVVLVLGELLHAPLPLAGVEGTQLCIGRLVRRLARAAGERHHHHQHPNTGTRNPHDRTPCAPL